MCRAREPDGSDSTASPQADAAALWRGHGPQCTHHTVPGSTVTARRRIKDTSMGLQHTPDLETQPLLKHPKPEQTLPRSGMLTRSKSRLAAAPLQAGPCQGGHQPGLAHCQAVPEIPDGPLVISAGWGRTGTSSLKVALDDLGYSPCFHARFFPYLPELFETLYQYAVGRRPDFPTKHLFRQFNSAVDIPAPLIPLVMEAYPDAKVILSVRDPDKWYDSYVASLLWLYRTWWFKPLSWFFPMGWKLQAVGRWWLLWEFGDDTMADREACIEAYLQHNAHIEASVPPEQLLVWQAKDGWEPLCRFLGVAAPDLPFPRLNEGASEMAWQIVRFIVRNPLALMGLRVYRHKGPLSFDSI